MTARLPAFACPGGPCLRDVREFLDTWGGQLALWVLPGIVLVAPLALGPRQLVAFGPTVVTVTVMALLFTVALPLHTYRQFQALRLGEDADEPATPGHAEAAEPAWTFTPEARLRPSTKARRVAELEGALLARLGLRGRVLWAVRRQGATVELMTAFMPSAEREALAQAYANLDLRPGAPLDEVRRAYRQRMRIVHPDQHRGDPATLRLSEDLAREHTAAYSTISTILRRWSR